MKCVRYNNGGDELNIPISATQVMHIPKTTHELSFSVPKKCTMVSGSNNKRVGCYCIIVSDGKWYNMTCLTHFMLLKFVWTVLIEWSWWEQKICNKCHNTILLQFPATYCFLAVASFFQINAQLLLCFSWNQGVVLISNLKK